MAASSSWEGGAQEASPAASAPAPSRGGTRLRVATYNAGALDERACLGPHMGPFRQHLVRTVGALVDKGTVLIGIQELNQKHGEWLREPG